MNTRTFVNKYKIRIDSVMVDANPNMPDMPDGNHYKCTLKYGKRQFTTYFSMGSAHCKDPTAEDLLDCLASDASGYDNCRGFEDWCSDYGYDTDSRKAEKTFNTIGAQTAKLRKFLSDKFDELLNSERL